MRPVAACGVVLALAIASPRAVADPGSATLSASIAGGGMLGSGTAYTPSGLFELELLLGYELGLGIRPEAGFLVGRAPNGYAGLRAGLHVGLDGLPVYVRADLDWATPRSTLELRWLLLGTGLELRLVEAFGLFAEADTGIPLRSPFGVPFELRGGVTVRF